MSTTNPISLFKHLEDVIPMRPDLREVVLPSLIQSVASVATTLRAAHSVSAVGSANAFGDDQLNVDVKAEEAVRAAIARCSGAVVTASSEEEPIESSVQTPRNGDASGVDEANTRHEVSKYAKCRTDNAKEQYTVAFDPLDGSSIIAANWTVGTIIGIWDGPSALNQDPSTRQVAAILGILGPRASAIVALRAPGARQTCFEVALPTNADTLSTDDIARELEVVRREIRFDDTDISGTEGMESKKARYFSPANLRAASSDPAYMRLITDYISRRYTLRYSGGLVPDVAHMLAKGHGIYLSPTDAESKPKLRRLYELCPIALVIECADGNAVDPEDGTDVLARPIKDVEERGGLICGVEWEVQAALGALLGGLGK